MVKNSQLFAQRSAGTTHGAPPNRLHVDTTEAAHMEDVVQNDANSDGSNIVCSKCLSGGLAEDNAILICDGQLVTIKSAYHQKCCEPLIISIPNCSGGPHGSVLSA